MGKIILVTGGSRSGKSSYALEVGQSVPGPRLFIATCPMTDDEMKTRIEAHQRERLPGNWKTIEEQTKIGKVLETVEESAVVLIDCLTLWVNNLMYRNEKEFENITEEDMEEFSSEVIRKCRKRKGITIFVSNEVGMGIVPGDKQTRLYRDLVGRCNQAFATEADAVVLVVCGIANFIKGELNDVIT